MMRSLTLVALVCVGLALSNALTGEEDLENKLLELLLKRIAAEEKRDELTGTVKWFHDEQGIGFITQDDGPDVFVYFRAISSEGYKTLTKGQRVHFRVTQGLKGPQAENVRVV